MARLMACHMAWLCIGMAIVIVAVDGLLPNVSKPPIPWGQVRCATPGRKIILRPSVAYACGRQGTPLNLAQVCGKGLSKISQTELPAFAEEYHHPGTMGNAYCLPGRDSAVTKPPIKCICLSTHFWDCRFVLDAELDTIHIPTSPPVRNDTVVPWPCTQDVLVTKMFAEVCNAFGQVITFEDCLFPQNTTDHTHVGLVKSPQKCLPGSYVTYLRCLQCRCGVDQTYDGCSYVSCPWMGS